MASLYKKRDIWYISLSIDQQRITRSLRTKDIRVAKQLKPFVETSILQQVKGFIETNAELTFTI